MASGLHRPAGLVAAALVLVVLVAGCGGSEAEADAADRFGGADGFEVVPAAEVTRLLGGNTAVGEWLGQPYRQYFLDDGATVYAEFGARSAYGRWRVDPDGDRYESWWNDVDGWETYQVLRKDGKLFWSGPGVESAPFVMVDGEQLVWPEDAG